MANITHHDINEILPIAAEIPIRPEVATYQLEDANQAILELKRGRVKGAVGNAYVTICVVPESSASGTSNDEFNADPIASFGFES